MWWYFRRHVCEEKFTTGGPAHGVSEGDESGPKEAVIILNLILFIIIMHARCVWSVCMCDTDCVWKLQDTFWELILSLYCELSGFNSACQPCMTNTFLFCCYCFQRNLFIYFTFWPQFPLPSRFPAPPHPSSLPCPLQSTSSLFLFRKGQIFHEYQQNTA